jgi:hypothetical protein
VNLYSHFSVPLRPAGSMLTGMTISKSIEPDPIIGPDANAGLSTWARLEFAIETWQVPGTLNTILLPERISGPLALR